MEQNNLKTRVNMRVELLLTLSSIIYFISSVVSLMVFESFLLFVVITGIYLILYFFVIFNWTYKDEGLEHSDIFDV